MKNDFEINENTRIIGRRDDGALLATNHPSISFNDIYEKAVILDENMNLLSSELPIGSITKFDYWEEENHYLLNSNVVQDTLLGFAVGDALGVPVETLNREDVKSLGLKDMVGNGVHHVSKGAWSDDTSMVISTMDSIINCDGLNYEDIMNNFVKWLDNGEYTSIDKTFGVGATVLLALTNYKNTADALNSGCSTKNYNGNGSLMRILPISLYCIMNNLSFEETKDIIDDVSSLTHAHNISKMGCLIYTEFLRELINTNDKFKAFEHVLSTNYSFYGIDACDAYLRLLDESFIELNEDEIKSTGYVVDTLEASLYCVLNTRNYEDAVLKAINLGGDTDTIAALTGSICGIIYTSRNIPKRWKDDLLKKEYLIDLSNKYYSCLINDKVIGGRNGK